MLHPLQLDRERGSYQLKESKLAQALVKALDADSHRAARAAGWKNPGAGSTTGIFHDAMKEVGPGRARRAGAAAG